MRRTDSGQLAFAFADSPQGGKGARPSDASGGKAFLLHTAKSTKAQEFVAPAADVNRLLEKVASPPNLASALLSEPSSPIPSTRARKVVIESERVTVVSNTPSALVFVPPFQ